MALIDLFRTKEVVQPKSEETAPFEVTITYEEYGKQQAETLGGTPEVIHPRLHSVYLSVKQKIAKDEITQNKRKAEIQSKIDVLEGEIENLKSRRVKKEEELKFEERKIEEAKSRITTIRQDPSKVIGELGSPKASFIIGLVIISFLTIYLFVFYSSAAYSAFFKQFNPGQLGIATAIFDAQALGRAVRDGFTEMILIVTIPAVFLGLGYLIHRYSTDKTTKPITNVLKIGALMLVTFAFDTILAYEISEKIYNIIKQTSFQDMPDYSLSMAFTNIQFWMIIFSGFVVYIIWGFVFNFVMKEYYNLDKVKIAIDELEKKIQGYKTTCKEIKSEIGNISSDITKNESLIKTHKNDLLSTIVYKSDVQLEINNFVSGWLSYMSYKNFSEEDKKRVVNIKDAFLSSITNQFDTVKSIQIQSNSNTNNDEK